jgi:Na+/H+ antiporter NhaD/arsenite permease-like protein
MEYFSRRVLSGCLQVISVLNYIINVFDDFKFWLGLVILIYLITALVLRGRRPKTPIWSIMAFASFMTIAFRLLSVDEVVRAIDLDVILFLIGMFSLVGLANSSGLLDAIAYWIASRFKTSTGLIYGSTLLFGLLAAFVVNDTVALMGPPIAYTLSRIGGLDPRMMFLLLAFSLTIGSTMTPIGNPQNVLIAVESGVLAPFITFLKVLALPTILNLLATAWILTWLFRVEERRIEVGVIPHEAIKNKRDALLAALGIVLTITLLVVNDLFELMGLPHIESRGLIPFVIAAGVYVYASNPRATLTSVDWGTIVFFMTMFITMEGVWRSGVLQPLLALILPVKDTGFTGIVKVSIISILLSQVLSNVPFVKLFITYMKNLGYTGSDTSPWITLAMASTIAGNLTILGAASNVIVLEVLESRMGTTITFTEFLKIGAVVTIINTLIYIPFLVTM